MRRLRPPACAHPLRQQQAAADSGATSDADSANGQLRPLGPVVGCAQLVRRPRVGLQAIVQQLLRRHARVLRWRPRHEPLAAVPLRARAHASARRALARVRRRAAAAVRAALLAGRAARERLHRQRLQVHLPWRTVQRHNFLGRGAPSDVHNGHPHPLPWRRRIPLGAQPRHLQRRVAAVNASFVVSGHLRPGSATVQLAWTERHVALALAALHVLGGHRHDVLKGLPQRVTAGLHDAHLRLGQTLHAVQGVAVEAFEHIAALQEIGQARLHDGVGGLLAQSRLLHVGLHFQHLPAQLRDRIVGPLRLGGQALQGFPRPLLLRLQRGPRGTELGLQLSSQSPQFCLPLRLGHALLAALAVGAVAATSAE
mmetsp:Transcript_64141/g.165096  ORF Transcript_64141/g.165096 Transcript_64141/m.165096 type:complete len:369 (-) Transcript_64141:1721-2827(-)